VATPRTSASRCAAWTAAFEEKGVPYHKVLIDEYNMPDWIEKVNPNGAQIPIVKDLETDTWVEDSGKIVTYLEDKFPEPKIGKPDECTQVGEGLMPAFMEFLKAKPEEQADKEKALVQELRQIDEHIKSSGGPYMAGDHVCAACLKIAPRLHHTKVATKAIKGWEIPEEFDSIYRFLDAMAARPSWKATQYTDKFLIEGWQQKISS
jgi:glutathione S-transferase